MPILGHAGFLAPCLLLGELGSLLVYTLISALVVACTVLLLVRMMPKGVDRTGLAQWAARKGFAYKDVQDTSLVDAYHKRFDAVFGGVPGTQWAEHVVEGHVKGLKFVMFDVYHQQPGREPYDILTPRRGTPICTAFIVTFNAYFKPRLKVRPETLRDKALALAGMTDINFESDEFSQAFHVSCDDRRFAYDVVNSSLMNFLMANRDVTFELHGGAMCVNLGKHPLPHGDWDRLYAAAAAILHRLPPFLYDDAKIKLWSKT